MNFYKPLGTSHKNKNFSNENIVQPTISQKILETKNSSEKLFPFKQKFSRFSDFFSVCIIDSAVYTTLTIYKWFEAGLKQ